MKIKDPASDRTFYVLNYTVLIMFMILVLYPLIYVLSASFSSASAIANNEVRLLPVGFNTQAYTTILASPRLLVGFANSVLYTVGGAIIGTVLTVLAGYASSRSELPFRRAILFFFVIPTLVSAGIVPTYIVVQQLGLLDTRWAILLPAAMPGILVGFRTALGQAWMAVVAAEIFGVAGVGQRMMQASSLLATDIVVVYMLTMAALYGLLDTGFVAFQKWVLRWKA